MRPRHAKGAPLTPEQRAAIIALATRRSITCHDLPALLGVTWQRGAVMLQGLWAEGVLQTTGSNQRTCWKSGASRSTYQDGPTAYELARSLRDKLALDKSLALG